jgi:diguanylate cyclase (GGDEF)-like protein
MSRSTLYRIFQAAIVLVTAVLVVWTLSALGLREVEASLFFAALVLCASFLRVDAGESSIAFEGPIVFGAAIIFHNPSVVFLTALVGSGLFALYEAATRKRLRMATFCGPAQLALSYYIVATLYTSAVASSAPAMAKVSGYILLLVGYLVVHLLFGSLRRYFEGDARALDYRRAILGQGRALLVLSPIVAIEVMLYATYDARGFAVAFLPLLLVAYAMRNEAEAGVHNAELLHRNRELSILTESSTQILSAEDDQETLRRLVNLLSKLARMKACAVVTWDPNPETPATVYRFGECRPSDQEVLRWVDSAGFAQSAPSRAFVFQDELRRFPLSEGAATQVLIGIQTPEVIYGILIFETEDRSILTTGSLNLLTLLVNQTGLALQDQLLRREMHEKNAQLERQASTMATILDVSNSLIGSFDIDGALTRIAQAIRKALGFQVVVFGLHDPKHDEFVRRAQAGLDDVWEEVRKRRLSAAEITSLCNAEFRVSNSFFVSHTALRQSEHDFFVRPEDWSARADEWHENDMLIVPLMSGEQMIGYLSVRQPADRRVPSVDQVQTLEIFAAQAVTALQSARQYDEIKRLTFIDALTPAFNHRYFQEALGKEIHRHARTGHEFALAMLDIDNFKKINDTFGHPVGDEILKGLVDELIINARDTDIVARYGGEEFALIFPDTPAQSARDAANRMRDLIERRDFRLHGLGLSRTLHVTISVGVAVYPADGITSADLIARADAALYFAKKNGKNQVAMAVDIADSQLAL